MITGFGYEGFNAVFITDDASSLDAIELLERLESLPLAILWHLWPAAVAVEQVLAAHLEFYEKEPAMVAALSKEPAANADLEIVRVESDAQLTTWVELLTGSKDPDFVRAVARLRSSVDAEGRPAFEHLLGVVEGEPVATAAIYCGSLAGEVQHVVTRADQRRRGYGAALTAAAMRRLAKRGYEQAVLTSSTEGFRVYSRLGFEPVGAVRRYLHSPESPEASQRGKR